MESIEKEEAEKEANRRRQFPVSPDDYYTKDEDMQLLVARFLSMNTQDKERMLDKNGWAWAQVQPLIDAFKAPDVSVSGLHRMVELFLIVLLG